MLVEIVKQFFDYTPPEYQDWNDAVTHFQKQVPELTRKHPPLGAKDRSAAKQPAKEFAGFLKTWSLTSY